MFRRIYRQKRRILFGTFFFTLFLFLSFWDSYGFAFADIQTPHFVWLTFAILFTCIALAIAVILSIFVVMVPFYRNMVEQISLALFIFEIIRVGLFPEGILVEYGSLTAMGWLAFLVFWLVFWKFTFGDGLDRFKGLMSLNMTNSAVLKGTPEEIWERFDIRPDHTGTHWEPNLHSVEPVAGHPGQVKVKYQIGAPIFIEQIQTQHVRNAPNHLSYSMSGDVSQDNKDLVEGTFDVRIDAQGDDHSRVTISLNQQAALPRNALLLWFDDAYGDRLDGLRAKLAGRPDWSIAGYCDKKMLALT